MNTNFMTVNYAYTDADISFDPVLLIENAKKKVHTRALAYIRTFELLNKSARIDLRQPWQRAHWSGLLNGVPESTERTGMSDSTVRFAVNVIGGPPLSRKDYFAYRSKVTTETLVGAALAVQLPTGEYKKDKPLNLGTNRYTFRPQLGVVHYQGRWSFEVTGSAWLFTENDSFLNDNRLEQDPLYTVQVHVVYTFPKRLWVTAGIGSGYGGESRLNGVDQNDRKKDIAWGFGAGYSITPLLNVSGKYMARRSQTMLGEDSDTFTIGLSMSW